MTKVNLIEHVWKNYKGKVSKTIVIEMVETVFEGIKSNIIADKKFTYPGFGTFLIRHRKARKGRDPRTGVEIQIKASRTVGFRPAKAFKAKI